MSFRDTQPRSIIVLFIISFCVSNLFWFFFKYILRHKGRILWRKKNLIFELNGFLDLSFFQLLGLSFLAGKRQANLRKQISDIRNFKMNFLALPFIFSFTYLFAILSLSHVFFLKKIALSLY